MLIPEEYIIVFSTTSLSVFCVIEFDILIAELLVLLRRSRNCSY